ncbi:MAG: DUF4399 domain-containing protein, partial [Pseudomonadota bacterium]
GSGLQFYPEPYSTVIVIWSVTRSGPKVTLELPVGTHTLQMVFADYAHVPFGPDLVTDHITITVE